MSTYTAEQIALAFIKKAGNENMKLHQMKLYKLVYIAQGVFMSLHNRRIA